MKALVTGSNGQLGKALQEIFDGTFVDVEDLDITDKKTVLDFDIDGAEAIINAAAFTNVDGAEDPDNYTAVYKVNVEGVANLALLAKKHDIPFVHISTDYIFDGNLDGEYVEDVNAPNPSNVYGYSKMISEKTAELADKYYVVRTSWVIGDGNNFVRTMLKLSQSHEKLTVVNDQIGRLTFTDTLAGGIKTLLDNKAEFGTYHITNSGQAASWADIAQKIFEIADKNVEVTGITTEEYFAGKDGIALRPHNSALNLNKSREAGVLLPDWQEELKSYIDKQGDVE